MVERFVTSLRIDRNLWKEAKKRAIEKDISIAEYIEILLKQEMHT